MLTVTDYSYKTNCSCLKVSFQSLPLTFTRGDDIWDASTDRWDASTDSTDRNAQILAWIRTDATIFPNPNL